MSSLAISVRTRPKVSTDLGVHAPLFAVVGRHLAASERPSRTDELVELSNKADGPGDLRSPPVEEWRPSKSRLPAEASTPARHTNGATAGPRRLVSEVRELV